MNTIKFYFCKLYYCTLYSAVYSSIHRPVGVVFECGGTTRRLVGERGHTRSLRAPYGRAPLPIDRKNGKFLRDKADDNDDKY